MMDAKAITEALGGTWTGCSGSAFCPAHENHRTPALSLRNSDHGQLLIYCHAGCSFGAILSALRKRSIQLQPSDALKLAPAQPVHLGARNRQAERARHIWEASVPIPGSPAEAYLKRRRIAPGSHEKLRFSAFCPHPSGDYQAAMIGLIEGSDTFAIHCTFIDTCTAMKAETAPARVMLGSAKGGAVRLVGGRDVLLVAEGIETCLSVPLYKSHPGLGRWAALSTSGLRALRLPARPSNLIIAADGDTAGRSAAYDLAERATALGWKVFDAQAPQGQDWNDVSGGGNHGH